MVTTILTHEVKDFTEWKKGFDSDAGNRDSMGVKINGVFQDAESPNHVTIISEVPSLEAIKGFLASPDMKANLEKAGVIGEPQVKILNKVG